MELLRFDSTMPNPRFEMWIEDLRWYLMTAALVVQPEVRTELRTKESAARLAAANA
jgi:hypothetical protein